MSKINLENVICWGDENDGNKTLCPECMEKEFPEYPPNWKPILSDEDIKAVYECDCCKERIVN